MPIRNMHVLLKRLARAYKHDSVDAFLDLLGHARVNCAKGQYLQIEEWLHNVALQTGALAAPTEQIKEFVADKDGRVQGGSVEIESLHVGYMFMYGEERVSELVDGKFTARIPRNHY